MTPSPPKSPKSVLATARFAARRTASSAADAIALLVRELGAPPMLGPARVEEAVQRVSQREASMSTALGGGVAIPHAFLEGLADTLVVVGTFPAGVPDWAADGMAVRLVILLLAPETAESHSLHLGLLAEVAGAVLRPGNVDRWAVAPDDDALANDFSTALKIPRSPPKT